MCQEKEEEEDSPALKIVSIHWYNQGLHKKCKERLILSDQNKQHKD